MNAEKDSAVQAVMNDSNRLTSARQRDETSKEAEESSMSVKPPCGDLEIPKSRRQGEEHMAKAKLPEPQSPEDATFRPSEKTPDTGAMLCDSSRERLSHLRSVELCPVRAVKEMSGAPKSRSDVQQGRTRDQPSGRESQGDGMPVVVVGVTTHQGGRESRPQGEGA